MEAIPITFFVLDLCGWEEGEIISSEGKIFLTEDDWLKQKWLWTTVYKKNYTLFPYQYSMTRMQRKGWMYLRIYSQPGE